VLLHEPAMSGLSGQATDIDIHAREILRMRAAINSLLVKHTGQTAERIERDVNRDFIMDAVEAKDYGLVDDIIHEKQR
jgi:ATP-dependent Clp protease protease subunit